LNRPEVLNALTLEDLSVIRSALDVSGSEVRGIAITGAGDRAFSSGMHIESFVGLTQASARSLIHLLGECLRAIRLAPIPTVAVINGYCLGAAFEMALACDVRVAHPEVRFGLPEVKLGIPSVLEAALLVDHIGLSKAKELIMTGDLYSAADLPPGLVNRTAPPDQLRSATIALLGALTSPTREVIAAQKSLFETRLNAGLDESIEASKDVFASIFEHPSTAQAIAEYRTQRKRRTERAPTAE
jgi:enoyl-CoA hydratase/carnithine racemase